MLNKQAKELLRTQPYIKDMAGLFIPNITALDIYKSEGYLNEQVAIHGKEHHRDIFINLRCFLEELEKQKR